MERLCAWLLTGPLGHLYSAVADIAVLGFRYARWRAARRSQGLAGPGGSGD